MLVEPFKLQLLKWVGNKQRFASEIISWFPDSFNSYYEPFLGSGAVLGTLAPEKGFASDILKPLVEIFQSVVSDPKKVSDWYEDRYSRFQKNKIETYNELLVNFAKSQNPGDLLFLSRSCYGGVIRFRRDGYMSTPLGIHNPISPESMNKRILIWHERLAGIQFSHSDFEATINKAKEGDLVYCDPPYKSSQTILYGAQVFTEERLFDCIERAKQRGVFVVVSLEGSKKSGQINCNRTFPQGLFEREVSVVCGRSMLKRFQMEGQALDKEEVQDRLLLTW